jgi:hypothetical protein
MIAALSLAIIGRSQAQIENEKSLVGAVVSGKVFAKLAKWDKGNNTGGSRGISTLPMNGGKPDGRTFKFPLPCQGRGSG